MLVLSRHRNEGFRIGDSIRIVVVDIRGDKVRFGVEAPTQIPVHRDEVYDRIRGDLGDSVRDAYNLQIVSGVRASESGHAMRPIQIGAVVGLRDRLRQRRNRLANEAGSENRARLEEVASLISQLETVLSAAGAK